MHKSLFIFLIFSTALYAQNQTINLPKGMDMEQAISIINQKKLKQEVEFAFDIHKVLVQKGAKSIFQTIMHNPYKWQLLRVLINPGLIVGLAGMVWQAMINTMPWAAHKYKELTAEELICLVRAHGNNELMALTVQIVNTQQVDPQVKEILLSLKDHGYPLRIASNIGKDIYIKFKQQLEDSNANIFALFNQDEHGMEGKTIDYRVSPVQKPDPEFFQEFLDAYDPHGNKLFIFVDDKLVNIKAAMQKGFVGIHFKNAEQLKNDLNMLGIII